MSGNGHGGKRHGAGRKPGQVKTAKVLVQQAGGAELTKASAGEILALQDEYVLWARHLHAKDQRIAFDALKYLTDKRDGRAFMQPNPNNPGKKDPSSDPRFLELLARFKPGRVTVTQTTIAGEEQPAELPPPTIEARLT